MFLAHPLVPFIIHNACACYEKRKQSMLKLLFSGWELRKAAAVLFPRGKWAGHLLDLTWGDIARSPLRLEC